MQQKKIQHNSSSQEFKKKVQGTDSFSLYSQTVVINKKIGKRLLDNYKMQQIHPTAMRKMQAIETV